MKKKYDLRKIAVGAWMTEPGSLARIWGDLSS